MSMWKLVEEAGVDRLLLPEELGGAGNAMDAAVQIAQRFGARCCAIPFIETLVANRWLWEAGVEVEPGPKTVALPVTSQAVTWAIDDVRIVCCDGSAVPAEALAGPLRSNLAAEPVRCLTPEWRERCSRVVSDNALALYATLKSAAIAGALHAALEMTLRYVNERTQFGRKIAAFQAVQHMVACMAEETAAATAAVQMASRRLGSSNQLYFAATAKSRVAEAATTASALAHQCHGAIGYTREHSLHRFTHRALAWRDDAGGEEYWNERIGRAALATCDGQLWRFVLEGDALRWRR
jgi:acyl-CoA dehydrogenase